MWPLRRTGKLITPTGTARYRRIEAQQRSAFQRLGTPEAHFFPHAIRHVGRPGPMGLTLAESIHGVSDPTQATQLMVFADVSAREEVPAEVFCEDECSWPRQDLGLPGLVAWANLVARGSDLLTTLRHATPTVERSFPGWDSMLLNAVLDHAARGRFRRILLPTADLARMRWAPDEERTQRVHDDDVQARFSTRREDDLWIVDVRENLERRVRSHRRSEALSSERTICIGHDTERELGHLGLDANFIEHAACVSSEHLTRMLEIEARAGVQSTYNVVGAILPELRKEIEAGGHELAFHSFDHGPGLQLERCRRVDSRLRGYRPPGSRHTRELDDATLGAHGFDWLASSHDALGTQVPALGAAVARIPILLDDFPLHRRRLPDVPPPYGPLPYRPLVYRSWEADLLKQVGRRAFTAFGLHDCYADHWLDEYPRLLEKLGDLGTLRTFGEVADRVLLGATP